MATVEASARAIAALNSSLLPGASQPLIVRFAESAEEKAARHRRREAMRLQRVAGGGAGGCSAELPAMAGAVGGVGMPASDGLAPGQLQQALAALRLGRSSAGAAAEFAASAPVQPAFGLHAPTTICIQGGCGWGCAVLWSWGASGTAAPSRTLRDLDLDQAFAHPDAYEGAPTPVINPQLRRPHPPLLPACAGLPPTADRLFLYEQFSRFGAVAAVYPADTPACLGSGTG